MKTIKIKRDECPGGFCIINEEDFIEGEMELFSGSPKKAATPASKYDKMTREQLADLLNERDIEFNLNMIKAKFISLLVESDKG